MQVGARLKNSKEMACRFCHFLLKNHQTHERGRAIATRETEAHDPRSIWAMAAMSLRSGGPATWALVVILGLGGAWLQPAKGPWVRHGRVGLRATGGAEAVDTDDLLVALGRNLWAAADELLEVSATLAALGLVPRSDDGNSRKFSPLGLGSAALALRNAADNILDDDWENAMGELEVASVSWLVGEKRNTRNFRSFPTRCLALALSLSLSLSVCCCCFVTG